ncbi:MAG TPA: right-handed parallel beta-helix repeat-containing protein [Myxococcota bacterium]|nr:right-handed parallel beta-helix repeat-containing protein [Myxococcota bacterium]
MAVLLPPGVVAGAVWSVTHAGNDGVGSLRQALLNANASNDPAGDVIQFAIPGAGPHVIQPITLLPALQDPDAGILLDGLSQAGASCATWPPTLRIVISGGAGAGGGLRVLTDDNVVRGLVVNGFPGDGIAVTGDGNRIECNFIGTDVAGASAVPNTGYGVYLNSALDNLIGGALPGGRNLISGNGQAGVALAVGSSDNELEDNYIGTDASGLAAIPNGIGVSVAAPDNTIGGPPGSGNVISGNTGVGISIFGATGTLILDNRIGLDPEGELLGNGTSGIFVTSGAAGTRIGASGFGNAIAGNGAYGVQIAASAGVGNEIGRNGFSENALDGITISAGANDPGDADEGANRGQNHPELLAAAWDGATLGVEVRVPSDPANADYPIRVELYRADPDQEEGEALLGETAYEVADHAAGAQAWELTPAAPIALGDTLVATATDAAGNSSAFSAPISVPASGPLELAAAAALLSLARASQRRAGRGGA